MIDLIALEFKPLDVTGLDDLRLLPLTAKNRCTGVVSWIRIAMSSGATGKPTIAASPSEP